MKRWDVLDRLIKQNGFEFVVELGVKEGKLTAFLLANNSDLRMVAVDLFAPINRADGPGVETYHDWNFEQIKREFIQRVEPYKNRVQLMQMLTTEAAPFVVDGNVDLVFIDAGHDYDSVIADIEAWLPKVRSGGIVSGHDYQQKFPGVQRAVAEKLPLHEIKLEDDSVWWWRKP